MLSQHLFLSFTNRFQIPSMFRKPKRSNIRQRRQDCDSDEDGDVPGSGKKDAGQEEVTVVSDPQPSLSTSVSHLSVQPVPRSKLSFAEDHDEADGSELFTVKKSGQSRRVAKQLEKEKRKREDEMAAKQREVRRLENMNASLSIRKQMEKKELDIIFVNQHMLKKEQEVKEEEKKETEVIQIPEEDGMSDADDDGVEDAKVTFRPAASRTAIPDAETIFSLKKQRQSRRNQDDFISLVQETGTLPAADADNIKNEDDDDDEFEDDRIEFEIDKTQSDRRKAQEAITSAQEESSKAEGKNLDSDSDSYASSDNEMSKWEEEQIMKGVGASSSVKVKSVIESHSNDLMDVSSPQGVNQISLFDKKSSMNSIPAHLSRNRTKVTSADVLNRLQEAVSEKKEKINYLDRQLNSMSVEEKIMNDELERLEGMQKEYDARRLELVQRLQQELKDKEVTS